jgi:Protein of unknown function (DUF3025)
LGDPQARHAVPATSALHPEPLPDIDWSRPWFEHLRVWGLRLPAGGRVLQGLRTLQLALPLSPDAEVPVLPARTLPTFVAQDDLPPGQSYEAHIASTGHVPTRDNLHDLLNGLMWMRHPALKWRMNHLQAAVITRDGIRAQRGSARDALTLFDESGAVWPEPDPVLLDALRRRDWLDLFVVHRSRWAGQRFEICGHALLEQLVRAPRKGLVAHLCATDAPWVMDEAAWSHKPFMPLPVLGIPGWWPGQEDPMFYRDTRVFRVPPS